MQKGVGHKCTAFKNQLKMYLPRTYDTGHQRGAELGSIQRLC